MKAIVHHRYGAPEDVLALEEIDTPTPADDQVLVRVRASSVNSKDWRGVRADPFVIRLMGGVRSPKEPRVGGDAAGIVEAVGTGVDDVKVGDEVYGARDGAFAEFVCGRSFVPKPANLSFEQAAAVPIAAITALQALRDKGGIQPKQKVAVLGAGGGVGTFTVQLACAFGAEVTATTSTDKVEMVRSIGADRVIDYTRDDITKGTEHFDLVLDVGGVTPIGASRRLLTPAGKLVLVGGGHTGFGAVGRLLSGVIRMKILRQPVVVFIANINKPDLLTLKELVEAGKLTPVIDREYPLSETPAAISYAEKERALGKVVITV